MFEKLLTELGTEHEILLRSSLKDIESIGGVRVREAIEKVRSRTIHIVPGYDNTYGIVEIWGAAQRALPGGFKIENKKDDKKQMDLEF
jgi:PHP family Zn ribbon phosphoesterase